MSRPIIFTPGAPAMDSLFSKWVELYIGQARLDDDEAEPFQQPLLDLENAIDRLPLGTMQDFFLYQTKASIFGDFDASIEADVREKVYALALAEAKERDDLIAAIDLHRAAYDECDQHFSEGAEFNDLSDREAAALGAIVYFPVTSVSNAALKGRYLAAVQSVGGLGFEMAEAFVRSFGGRANG